MKVVSLPVKKSGQAFFRPKEPLHANLHSNGPKQPKRQKWFKKKYGHHRLTSLEELHDEEVYYFHETTPTHGAKLRAVPGYRLKRNWKAYRKAFSPPMAPKFRKNLYKKTPDSNWLDVILPNGMLLSVQPRSWTPSYYVGDEKLETWLFERYGVR